MGRPRARKGFTNWKDVVRENENWETYYRKQQLLSEDEFTQFKVASQRDLPLTFRITGIKQHALEILELMRVKYIDSLKNTTWEGVKLPTPMPLKFIPDDLAWQVDVAKQVVRKCKQFAQFQRFLVVETAVGNVTRQEAVSMIPPLLLDVQPYHTVLDACASPGSKTTQLIEALHQKGRNPTGFVVANDADYKRSKMLIHQIKRLHSAHVVVVNHDAQFFPKIRINDREYLKFDRILCDVPCSGDGTMRKNLAVWKDWNVNNGLGLHQVQINITVRGLQMLKPGGRLVYSTCSLNPIEDEAVIAQVLRQCPGVRLVDVSGEVPNLVRSPGVSQWLVQSKDKQWHETYDVGLPRSLFPPSVEEAARFNLCNAIRVYPHQQDTGGFFIAVLEKEALAPKKRRLEHDVLEDPQPASSGGDDALKTNKVVPDASKSVASFSNKGAQKEEPFIFLDTKHPVIENCWKFYGVRNLPRDTLFVRNNSGEPLRTIYFVAEPVKRILQLNSEKVQFVNAGIKLFNVQKNEGSCQWRVQSEGLELFNEYCDGRRLVRTSNEETLRFLCEEQFPAYDELSRRDPELARQIQNMDEGCCFWDLNGTVYPLWKGHCTINLMASKEIIAELKLRKLDTDNVEAADSEEAVIKEEKPSA